MLVKVITDSSSVIPDEVQRELGISVVPIWLHVSGESFRDGVELDLEDFYARLSEGEPATTSSSSPGDFLAGYREAATEGHDAVLVVTPSAKLSGSFNAALAALNDFDGIPVEIFDSSTAIVSQGFVVVEAARLARQAAPLEEVRKRAETVADKVDLVATIDTLRYLRRSGRVNLAQFMLGETLRVHPLFRLRRGEVQALAPSISKRSALDKIIGHVISGSGGLHAGVFHGNAPKRAQFLQDGILEAIPDAEVFITRFSPAMGAHTGPGVVGVSWWRS